jgi:hypothetical protein
MKRHPEFNSGSYEKKKVNRHYEERERRGNLIKRNRFPQFFQKLGNDET